MKEDYLWDKTGSDNEIEDLENSLKAFRSKNTVAPKLPQKTFAFDRKSLQNETPRRLSFRFAFVAFGCLTFAIISLGVFQVLNVGEQQLAQNTDKKQLNEINTQPPIVAKSKYIAEEKVEKQIIEEKTIKPTTIKAKLQPKRKAKRHIVKIKKQVRANIKNDSIVAKQIRRKPINIEPQVTTVKLTKEEKDAYDKLMRALSITGSQMRIVQEKINGSEEKPVEKKEGR